MGLITDPLIVSHGSFPWKRGTSSTRALTKVHTNFKTATSNAVKSCTHIFDYITCRQKRRFVHKRGTVRGSLVVSTSACHVADRGSIPGQGTL